MKKLLFIGKVCKSRYIGLRPEIKYPAIISLFSILLIELFLTQISSVNSFQHHLATIYLKVCYSFFSAFIFYFLVVYAPKERRRVKSFRFINNKILSIEKEYEIFLLTLLKYRDLKSQEQVEISRDLINSLCANINPHNKLTEFLTGQKTFNDYFLYINFYLNKIKNLTSELIILHDMLDEELLRSVTTINDQITKATMIDLSGSNQTNLNFLSHDLYEIHFEIKEMVQVFLKNYRHKYDFHYHHFERKRNAKKE